MVHLKNRQANCLSTLKPQMPTLVRVLAKNKTTPIKISQTPVIRA